MAKFLFFLLFFAAIALVLAGLNRVPSPHPSSGLERAAGAPVSTGSLVRILPGIACAALSLLVLTRSPRAI